MNLEQMQYIVEVARTKSLIAASKNLFITQSALSQSISNLEIELGIKLFTRSRKGTLPTQEGKIVIKKALEIVIKVQEIREEAQNYTDTLSSELRIASIPVGMASLVKTISSFKSDYPRTNFQITQSSSKEILHDIRENKLDLGLIATKKIPYEDKELIYEPFWEGKIVVGVGMSSPLSGQKRINARELLKYPFVFYDEDYVHEFVGHFAESVGPLQTLFTSNNPIALIYALEEGLAITCGYDFSFLSSSYLSKSNFVTLEIDQLDQNPLSFAWVRSINSEKTTSQKFVNRFIKEIQSGYHSI